MTYLTGRYLTQADSTMQLLPVLHAAFVDHPAWEHVEDVVAGTLTGRVYRNLGAVNSWGQDWYLVIRYTNTAPSSDLAIFAAEGWDATAKTLIRPCSGPQYTRTPSPTFAAVADTTGYPVTDGGTLNVFINNIIDDIDTTYWIKITSSGFWMKTNLDSFGTYAGLFEPFFPDYSQEFPLVVHAIGNTDVDGAGSVSRRPGVTTSLADCFAVFSHVTTATMFTTPLGSVPFGSDLVMGQGRCYGSRWVLYHTIPTGGGYRGLIPDCLIFQQDAGVTRGDTMLVEGRQYLCIDDAGTYGIWIDTEAA